MATTTALGAGTTAAAAGSGAGLRPAAAAPAAAAAAAATRKGGRQTADNASADSAAVGCGCGGRGSRRNRAAVSGSGSRTDGGEGAEGEAEGPPPPALQRLRRRLSTVQQLWIYPFTHYKPTNQVMLCYRTLFQDLNARGHNDDFLAAAFRDDLMPFRGWVHKHMRPLLHINRLIIAGPIFGCPGIMRYLDARTRWLDAVVAAALAGGCQQVVVVAAGYDSRAYRFGAAALKQQQQQQQQQQGQQQGRPDRAVAAAAAGGVNGGGVHGGVHWFEVDLPSASASKRALVDRTLPADLYPRPTYIAADLSQVSLAEALLGSSSTGTGSSSTGTVNGHKDAATASPEAAAATAAATAGQAAGGSDGGASCSSGGGGRYEVWQATEAAVDEAAAKPVDAAATAVAGGGGGPGANGGNLIHVKAGPAPVRGSRSKRSNNNTTNHPPTQQAPQAQQAQHGGRGGGGGGGGGFDPTLRTLFTVEGLVYYLPPAAVSRLLASIRSVAAPGSRLAFDYLEQDVFAGRRFAAGYETLRLTVANKGEPKRSGLDPGRLQDYLGGLGWRLTYAPSPQQVAAEMYPHLRWHALSPPIVPFYRFALAEAAAEP
ncbi:hypothetical protein HXX76_010731 [Chlamydomonas incerta]|uniref:S-adenosyl-L-methionine-dependent methyltransferase n=1 Tax=Chlamydomonas incerta TaxID=51695 RepID=A0A835SZ76_CHLIN|nr:hypothetical protein HXX76_010731 [Chlamydomonas incerta]|eukprot:KAG2429495.1 hypothetical protein HXX76_010731 [Chlamydomonas incerta]